MAEDAVAVDVFDDVVERERELFGGGEEVEEEVAEGDAGAGAPGDGVMELGEEGEDGED